MKTDHIADPRRTYALVVGIEKYALGPEADLNGPAHDARRFADWLSARGVPQENLVLLLSPLDEGRTLLDQWPGPYKWPATRESVDYTIHQMVDHWMGDLLYIFWGGHGVMTADRRRRLFYADTTPIDWHHLVLDSLLIHLSSHYLSGLQQQICLVDACANYQRRFSQEQLGEGDTFLPGEPLADPEQFVLLSTREGEVAKNRSQEQTGYFTQIVLEELAREPETLWPPDMEGIAERVKKRFETLRREKVIKQTPVSIQYQTWDRTKRSSIQIRQQTTEALHRGVFIAASTLDQAFVLRLRSALEAQGISLWSQDASIPDTPENEEVLRQAIRMASAVLLIASPDACHSRTIKASLRLSVTYQQQVIVLWARGTAWETSIPEGWSKREYIDARETSYEMALQEAVARLKRSTSVSAPLLLETDIEPRNPYKGLRAFRREDARDFFGRDAPVQELVEALGESLVTEQRSKAGSRLLAVIGPSGSGKSSVVMAGLIPSLQGGALDGSQEWIYLEPLGPGSHPLEALALTLSHQLPERSLVSLREDLAADSARGLHLLADRIAKRSGTHVVLFVDQFEELFTQTITEGERQQFIDLLVAAITEPRGPLIVLLALRADFYDRPIHYSELARLIKKCQHLVIPMEVQDLRVVIEQPAMLPEVQMIFEDTLVGDLLFEVQGQAGALPLLQFTLEQLFERRSGHRLTLQAYHEIGGVKGALAKQAESTYASLPSEEYRKLTRSLFLRLIDAGLTEQDTTRRRASLAEFSLPDPKQTNLMRESADAFVMSRLLTTNEVAGKTTIEVSHEALIREWPRLAEWLHEAREDIILQQAISSDAADWVRRGKPADRVYRGAQLIEAQAWAERNMPSTEEIAFLQAGIAERQYQEEAALNQKERELNLQHGVVSRQRILITALSIFSVIVIVLASVAGLNFLRAEMEAQIARSDALVANASSSLTKNQLDLALLLSVKATQTANTPESRDGLLSALERSPQIVTMLRSGSPLPLLTLTFGSDDRTLVSSDGSSVYIWNAQTKQDRLLHLDDQLHFGGVALSSDNRTLATSNGDGVWLWDIRTDAKLTKLEGRMNTNAPATLEPHTAITFSSDGKLVASGRCIRYSSSERTPRCIKTPISVWNISSKLPHLVGSFVVPADVKNIAFSPDGKTLTLAVSSDRGVQVWSTKTNHASPLTNNTGANSVAFSPDGRLLASGNEDGTVELWKVVSGQLDGPPVGLRGHTGQITGVAFSRNSDFLASSSTDQTVRLWMLPSGQLRAVLTGDAQKKWCIAFSSNGKTLASGSEDGTILLWNIDNQSTFSQPLANIGGLSSPVFSTDGTMIFTGSANGKIFLQKVKTEKNGQLVKTFDTTGYPTLSLAGKLHQNPLAILSLALSRTGSILASGRLDGTIILWDPETGKIRALFGKANPLYKIVLSSDGQILAASSEGDTITLWNATRGTMLYTLPYSTNKPSSKLPIALSPDGKVLAVGGCGEMKTDGSCGQGQVQLWDVTTGKVKGQPLLGHTSAVQDVAFSPDGHTLVSSSRDAVILWQLTTRKPADQVLPIPTDPSTYYNNILFSPDGQMLALASAFGSPFSFVLWDLAQNQLFAHPIHQEGTASLGIIAFNPNGEQLVSVSVLTNAPNSGIFTLWDISIKLWQEHACSIANRNLTQGEFSYEPNDKVCPKLVT